MFRNVVRKKNVIISISKLVGEDGFVNLSRSPRCICLYHHQFLLPKLEQKTPNSPSIKSCIPCSRSISFVPNFLSQDEGSDNKRKSYAERRILGYTMEQMYPIVAGVQHYPEFVPGCSKSTVFEQRPGSAKCKLEIDFQVYTESYVSVLTLVDPNLIKSECTEGKLFNHLLTIWRFSPGPVGHPNTCTLDFSVTFEFRSAIYSQVSGMFFDLVVKQMVSSFLDRAEKLHGAPSVPRQKPKVLKYVH